MKKALTLLSLALLLAGGGAYYYLSKGYAVDIPRQEIANHLMDSQPITRSYFFVIDVTLKNPRLSKEQPSNRLRAAMDVVLKVDNGDTPLEGAVDLSGVIGYRPEHGGFHLTQPSIDNLAVAGIPEKYTGKARDAITQAMAEYFSQNPLYTLKPGEGDALATRFGLKRVAIEADRIVAILGL